MKNYIVILIWCLSCIHLASRAQELALRGTILDRSTEIPLADVTIKTLPTNKVTRSNTNGTFNIKAEMTDSVLQVSRVGYRTQNIPIETKRDFTITLEPDDQVVEEVIVTGYQKERKKDLTGAVSVVTMEDIEAPLTGNVMKSLQGRVPGAFITSDGAPDGSASVLIRGIGTLGNNNPLYIIDGMPSTKSMNEISGMDIESIQVLKDASAASIYGSRAANGVIIITTKKGKSGITRVEARASSAIRNYSKSLDWLNTHERGFVQWRAARNDGTDPNFGVYEFRDRQDDNGSWYLDEIIIPEFLDEQKTMRAADTDWADEIGRNGIAQNYNATLSTGSDASSALFSLDYLDNKGTVRGTYFNRIAGRINTDFQLLNGKVVIGENFSVTKIKQDVLGSLLGNTRNIQPIVPVHTVDGNGWGGPVAGMSDRQNPMRLIADNKQNHANLVRAFGDMHMSVKLSEALTFRSMFGIDYSYSWERNMQKTYTSGFMSEPVASVNVTHNRWGNYVWNNTLNYKKDIQERHHLDVLIGQEYINYIAEDLRAGRRQYASEDPDYMYLDAGEGVQTNGGSGTAYRLQSYFGKINYNFDDRYLASITARYDGSSRFGYENQYGLFPAFSLGWRLSEENFLKQVSFLSDLKVRYGWGRTGNQEIGDFASFGMFEAAYATNPTNDPDNGTAYDIEGKGTGNLPSGYRRIQQPNPNLKWETAEQHNIGLDFGVFNNKFVGSFDYFSKTTSDILISPPFIATLGEGGNRWVNGATMANKGYEFILTYADRTGDWSYTVTGNLAGYRNRVNELPDDVINSYPGNGFDQHILGRPLNSFFGYVADGLFQSAAEVNAHAQQIGAAPGRIRYLDVNGDGVINDADRTWIGVADPKFVYGLNFSVTYKQFDFGMFWNGIHGGLVNNGSKGFTDFISFFGGENYGKRVLSAWTPEQPDTDIPALSFNDLNDEKRFSTYYVESSSYFKLRTLELGYSFTQAFLNKVNMQGLRVYLLGENLLRFKTKSGKNKYTGVDPETPNSGYPIPFSITAGINLSF